MENNSSYARYPQTMQIKPKYDHVLLDIYDFLKEKLKILKRISIIKKLF